MLHQAQGLSVADPFGLLPFRCRSQNELEKASSDLDQASMSPSEEENSESSSESEKTSDQVSSWPEQEHREGMLGWGRMGLLPVGPMSGSLLSTQDFTPEKKAVVRGPAGRGPLPGRKKRYRGLVLFPSHMVAWENPYDLSPWSAMALC